MESIIILLILILTVIGPVFVFGWVGYRAMVQLGKRPAEGGKVFIPLILKLVITAAVLLGLLMVVLEVFGAEYEYRIDPADGRHIIARPRPFRAEDLKWIEPDALERKLEDRRRKTDLFHLVDLRNEADYRRAHIEGAVNVPFPKLSFLAEKLFAKNEKIIFYDYSAATKAGENAVIFLFNKGYVDTALLKGGFTDWDGPVEKAGSES